MSAVGATKVLLRHFASGRRHWTPVERPTPLSTGRVQIRNTGWWVFSGGKAFWGGGKIAKLSKGKVGQRRDWTWERLQMVADKPLSKLQSPTCLLSSAAAQKLVQIQEEPLGARRVLHGITDPRFLYLEVVALSPGNTAVAILVLHYCVAPEQHRIWPFTNFLWAQFYRWSFQMCNLKPGVRSDAAQTKLFQLKLQIVCTVYIVLTWSRNQLVQREANSALHSHGLNRLNFKISRQAK